MSEFVKILLRKNSLRKACNDLSITELEKVVSDLEEIFTDKVAYEEAIAAENAVKQEAIAAIQAQIVELGLSPEDFVSLTTGKTSKATVKPKYRLIDAEGKAHEWSGRGRTPLVYQERFDQGAQKDDFLIQV